MGKKKTLADTAKLEEPIIEEPMMEGYPYTYDPGERAKLDITRDEEFIRGKGRRDLIKEIKADIYAKEHSWYKERSAAPTGYTEETKYDAGISPGQVPEYHRGQEQSGWSKFARGFASRGLSIPLKIAQMFGHFGGAAAYVSKLPYEGFNADPNIIWDNAVVNALSDADKQLREEEFPIYGKREYYEGDILAQMGTAKFWADDAFDAIAFAASAYGVGAGVGAAGKAMGLAKGALKGFQIGGSAVINTVGESGFEAHEINKRMRDELAIERHGKTYDELDQAFKLDIKEDAGISAKNTFVSNLGVLAIPNLIQSRFFFGKVGNNAKKMKDLVKAGKLSTDDINIFRTTLKRAGVGAFSESLMEEGPQSAVQRYEERKSMGETDMGRLEGYAYEWLNNFEMPEGQKSMVLGALVGTGMGLYSGMREGVQEMKQVATMEESVNRMKALMDVADMQYAGNIKSIYKTFDKEVVEKDEEGNEIRRTVKSYLNEEGNPELDLEKANKLFYQQLDNKRLWKEGLVATINNDNIHERIIKNEALSRRFYDYITNPEFESEAEAVETLKEREIRDVTEEDESVGVAKRMAEKQVDKFLNIYKEVEESLIDAEDLTTKDDRYHEFKDKVAKALFYEAVKRDALEDSKSLTKKEKAVEGLEKLIEDSQKRSDDFLSKNKQKKLFKEYLKELDRFSDLENRIKEEQKKEKPDLQAIEDLQYTLDEQRAISGREDPNKVFSIVEGEAERLGEFGMRNDYFYRVGNDAVVSGIIDEMIDNVKKGRVSPAEVIRYIENNKEKITKEDIDKVSEVISVQSERANRAEEESKRAKEDINEIVSERTQKDAEALLMGVRPKTAEDEKIDELKKLQKSKQEQYDKQVKRGAEKSKKAKGLLKDIDAIKKQVRDQKIEKRKKEDRFVADEMRMKQNNKVIDRAEEEKNNLEQLKTFFEEFEKRTKSRTKRQRIRSKAAEERFFKRAFADLSMDRARNTEANYENNPDNFTKVNEVSQIIDRLKQIKKIYNRGERKKYLETKEFDGFIESINKTLERMDELLKVAIENRNNREAANEGFQKNINELFFIALGMQVDQKTGEFKIIDKEVYDKVRNAVGHDLFDEIIKQAKTAKEADKSAKFHKIFSLKILDIIKDKGRVKSVVGFMEEKLSRTISEFKNTFLKLGSLKSIVRETRTIQKQLNDYEQNPAKEFEILIKRAVGVKQTERKVALDEFFNNKDVLELKRNLEGEKETSYSGISKNELLSIIDLQIKIEGLSRAIDNLESSSRIAEQIATEKELHESSKLAPSSQQVNAIREGVSWFNTKVEKGVRRFQNWAYMKGLAGTGKTTVAVKWMINSLGLKSNEFIVVSHGERQIKTIHDSLNPEKDGVLTQELTPEKIDKDVKVVVIDEIGALDSNQLFNLGETIKEINEKRKTNPVKVIVLGDPTQVNKNFTRTPAISQSERGQINIHELQPLTIVYRSNVSSVLDIQNIYQDNERKVSGIATRATDVLGKPATGVHSAGTTEELKAQIKAHSRNNRTKVIIVDDEKTKRKYDDIKDVDVETIVDAAGQEWDEVYVDISNELIKDTKKFNTAMYTALSRAKEYIFVLDHTGSFKNEVAETESVDKDKIEKDLEKANNEYEDRLIFEAGVIGDEEVSKAKPTTSQMRDVEEEDVGGVETPSIDDESGEDESNSSVVVKTKTGEVIKTPAISEDGVHDLEYPSYEIINYHKSGMHGGPRVRIVRYEGKTYSPRVKYIMVWNKQAKRPELHVVAEELNNDGKPVKGETWHLIGIVGLEDIKKEGNELLMDAFDKITKQAKNPKAEYNNLSRRGQLRFKENHPSILIEGKLQSSVPLTYEYSKKTVDKGKGLLSRIMSKFNLGFHKRRKTTTEVSVRIFKNTETFEGEKIADTHFKAGVPYLIISTKAWKREGEGKPVSTQYIRLNPRRLKKGDRGLYELEQFTNAIKELEKIGVGKLGSPEFNSLIKRFKRNYKLDGKEVVAKDTPGWTYEAYTKDKSKKFLPDMSEEQFNEVSKKIDPIVKLFYGYGKTRVEFANEEEMREYEDEKGNKPYVDTGESRFAFEKHETRDVGYVREVNPEDPDDRGSYIYKDDLKAGEGRAQKVVNFLASANSKVGEQKFRVLYSQLNRKTKKRYKVSFGKSLLAGEDTYGEYFKELLRIFKSNIPKEIRNKYTIKDASDIDKAEEVLLELEFATREQLADLRRKHTVPTITSDVLDQMLTFNKETDEHEQLLLPLDYDEINKLGENIDLSKDNSELEDKLSTPFKKVNPTKIQVRIDETGIQKAKKFAKETIKKVGKKKSRPKKDKGERASDRIDDIIDERSLRKDKVTDLGKKISITEARKLAKKLTPDISDEMIQFVDQMTLDSLSEEDLWGLFKNGVVYILKNDDGTVYKNVVRHEIFHKIFNQYLTRREQKQFIKAFHEEFPDTEGMSIAELDEEIAVKFQEWRGDKNKVKSSFIRRIFDRILRFFNFINNERVSLDTYFERIERGYFSKVKTSHIDITRALINIEKVWGSLDTYFRARKVVEGFYNNRIKNGYEGLPLTRKELYHKVLQDLIDNRHSIFKTIQNNAELAKEDDEVANRMAKLIRNKELLNLITKIENGTPKNFHRLINDIYPVKSIKTQALINPNVTLSDEEIFENWKQLGDGVIGKHTVENGQVNRESKISEDVKDFLSGVKVGKKSMNWRESYIRMLDVMQGLQPNSEKFIEQVKESIIRAGSEPRTVAVADYFLDEWDKALSNEIEEGEKKGQILPNNSRFINEDSFIYSEDDITGVLGINDARNKGFSILTRKANESTVDFAERIMDKTDFDKGTVSGLLRKEMSAETIRGIVNNFTSLRKMDIRIGRSRQERGKFTISYITGKALGPNSSMISTVRNAIREKYRNSRQWNRFRNTELPELLKKSGEDSINFVRRFLGSINLGYLAVYLPERNIETIKNDIIEFVNTHSQGAFDEDAFERILETEGHSLINNLAEAISYNNEFIRATSVRDSEGKNKYMWLQSTFANDVLLNLINQSSTKEYRGTGKMKALSLPGHLRTKFFSNNIFVKGINKIYSIIDYDGAREIDWRGNEYSTPYKKELPKDWLARNFVYAFLGNIKRSRKGSEKYTQYFYTLSDRPNIVGAEVKVLTPKELITSLENTLTQIMNRDEDLETILEKYKKDKTVNLNVLEKVLDGRDLRKKPLKEKEIPGLAKKMYSEIVNISEQVTELIIDNSVNIDKNIFNIKKINKFVDKNKFPDWNRKDLAEKYSNGVSARTREGEYTLSKEELLPVVHAYVANNYINSYHLNQLVAGDQVQYEDSKDVLKRMSLIFSPGMRGFVHDDIGMNEKYKTAVVEDPINNVTDIKGFLQRILGKKDVSKVLKHFGDYMPGDGQGFITPERFDELNRGFNSAFDLRNVVKPVYFGVDENGVARGVKYSVVVLSDDITSEFPALRNLRQNMRDNNWGEVVFNSAVKIGNPTTRIDLNEITTKTGEDFTFDKNSVMELSNSNYRISQNPKSSIDDGVRSPTQLSYFLNVLGTNVESAKKVYNSLTYLIEDGLQKFDSEIQEKGLRSRIMSLFSAPGQERKKEMLAEGLSLNFPAISSSIVTHLSSALTSDTVAVRFPGRVHVLQSSLGIKKNNGEELQYEVDDNGNLYAEVLVSRGMLPKAYEDRIDHLWKQGMEEEGVFIYNDAFGFRLPSSELHSGVPLKVVGFYDTLDTNVVVAPKELVPLHGSDFDVDELFIIARVLDDAGKPVGYKKDDKGKWRLMDKPGKKWNKDTLVAYHKNIIVESFLEAFSAERNRERMMSPITTKPLEDEIQRLYKISGLTEEEMSGISDLSNPVDNLNAHNAVFVGKDMIGRFANSIKMLAYMIRSGEKGSAPKITKRVDVEEDEEGEPIEIVINGVKHDRLREYTLDKNGKENKDVSIWELFDSALNAAVDNFKLLLLPQLNINAQTSNAFTVLLSHGVNFSTLNNIMMQPVIRELGEERFNGLATMRRLLLDGLGMQNISEIDLPQVNDKMLVEGLKWKGNLRNLVRRNPGDITNKDRNFFRNQLAVLENVWSKAEKLSDDMLELNFFIDIVNNMPAEKYMIDEQIDFFERTFGENVNDDGSISKEDKDSVRFSHDISNFLTANPHIFSAYKVLKSLHATISDNISKHSKALYDFIDEVRRKNGVDIKLDRIRGKSNELMREEFVKYLMSGLKRFEDVPAWTYRKEGEERRLTGPKAFSQHFIDKIEKAKKLLPNNVFLRNLETRFDPQNKTYFIRFSGGTNLDGADLLKFQESFMEINSLNFTWDSNQSQYEGGILSTPLADNEYSDFQRDFVTYGIYQFGLRFGTTNYSMILPVDLYKDIDRELNSTLGEITREDNTGKLRNLIDHFTIEAVMNHTDAIAENRKFKDNRVAIGKTEIDGKKVNTYSGEESGIVFDRKYKNPEKKEMPLIIKESYRGEDRIYIRISDPLEKTVYYQKIGSKNRVPIYNLNRDVIENGYDINKAFDPGMRNVQTADNKSNFVRHFEGLVKVGDVVSLTNYHDPTRIDKRIVEVVKIGKKGFNVKDVSRALRDESIVDKYVNSLKKRLNKRGSPFRAAVKGRIAMINGREGEGTSFVNRINEREFNDFKVLRRLSTNLGYEIKIDRDEISDWLFGKQGTLFSPERHAEDIEGISGEEMKQSHEIQKKEVIEYAKSGYTTSTSVVDKALEIRNRVILPEMRKFIDGILPVLRKAENKIEVIFEKIDGSQYAQYDPLTGVISVDIEKVRTADKKANLFLFDMSLAHELFHVATATTYMSDEKFAGQIKEFYNKAKEEAKERGEESQYGLNNEYEFMAEAFRSPKFREFLKEIRHQGNTLLSKIWNAIKAFFGMPRTLLDDVEKFIMNYDLEVYAGHEEFTQLEKENPFFRKMRKEYMEKIPATLKAPVEEAEVIEEKETLSDKEKSDKMLEEMKRKSEEVIVEENEKGEEADFYIYLGKKIKRATDIDKGFLNNFIARDIDTEKSVGERMADAFWGNVDHETKLRTDEGELENHEEYKDRIDYNSDVGKVKGKVVHKKIERIADKIFNDGRKIDKIDRSIRNITSMVGIDPNRWNWVEDNIRKIMKNVGINTFSEDVPDNLKDELVSEIRVISELLGYGGSADMLAQHSDGKYTVVDWKTGSRFNTRTFLNLLRYGNQEIEVTDNPKDRAKLQIMFYAFMLKLENPNIQFRNLIAAWIPNKWRVEYADKERFVEVNSYLPMLESFFKDKKALKKAGLPENIYQKVIKKSPKAFWVSEYTNQTTDSLIEEVEDSKFTPEQVLDSKYAELDMIVTKKRRIRELSAKDQQRVKQLTEDIHTLRADPSMQIVPSGQYDISKVMTYIGNYSDVPHPRFQLWKKYRDRRREQTRAEVREKWLHMQALLKPIVNEYKKGIFSSRKLGMADINYKELYKPFYKYITRNGLREKRLVIPSDEEYNNLSDVQKKFVDFLNAEYKSWFVGPDAYMNQIATYKTDPQTKKEKGITYLELINQSRPKNEAFEYYDGWFPKTLKTMEEVRYDIGGGSNVVGSFSPEYFKEVVKRKLTTYIEDTYEGWSTGQDGVVESLPVNYLGSLKINTGEEYTDNLEFSFDQFIRSTTYKKYMDSVYTSGKALHQWLSMQDDGEGQPMFENTAKFLEKKLIGDVLNRQMRMKMSRTPIRVMGEPIQVDKVIDMFTHWTSATIMWLRPMQGGGNGLHARGLTYREALKGTIASSFLHIDGDAIDFKVADNIFADRIYFSEFMPKVFMGKVRKSKMWLLSEAIDYLPDNYDYATNRRFMLSTRNKTIDKSSMYAFHSKPEEYVSLTTMTAQLHYLKHPKTGKSLWDCYKVKTDPKTGVTDVVWDAPPRGYQKTGTGKNAVYKEINGLTSEEIAKLKKVHERMQGGYRKEEAANLEIYALGRSFIQFKKYLPRLLINTYHSKRLEYDLGNWKKLDEVYEGEDVYERTARLNEGRWKTVINAMLNVISLNKKNKNYRWSVLSTEQKQNIVDCMIVLSQIAMFYGAYLALFEDEDDDDTLKKWWKMYLVDNMTQQYNVLDLLRTLESASTPVALARTYKTVTSFAKLTVALTDLARGKEDAFTQAGDLRGWNNFKKSIPGLASYYDFHNKVTSTKSIEPDWLTEFQHKWR